MIWFETSTCSIDIIAGSKKSQSVCALEDVVKVQKTAMRVVMKSLMQLN